jgi:hypothetical protein
MLLHTVPRFYNSYKDVDIQLVDIQIPEINLNLRDGIDIVARKPYPNKCLLVACKKKTNKAMEGLLIRLPDSLKGWTVITRWSENAEHLFSHTVKYNLMDSEFDTVTDCVSMWSGYQHSILGNWEDRHPHDSRNTTPIHLQPSMEYLFNNQKSKRIAGINDMYSEEGLLISRTEDFTVPTIEIERLFSGISLTKRIPSLSDSF